jgi:hypothetical protein
MAAIYKRILFIKDTNLGNNEIEIDERYGCQTSQVRRKNRGL